MMVLCQTCLQLLELVATFEHARTKSASAAFAKKPLDNQTSHTGAAAWLNGTGAFGSGPWAGQLWRKAGLLPGTPGPAQDGA